VVGWTLIQEGKYDEAFDLLTDALTYQPNNDVIICEIGALYVRKKEYNEAIAYYRRAIDVNLHNRRAYAGLELCYRLTGDEERAEEYRKKVRTVDAKKVQDVRASNYMYLVDKVISKNIKLVIMQYPMRDLEEVQLMTEHNPDILYIDNDTVFRNAIYEKSYRYYFRDNFAGNFGHCTKEGNQLYAEHIADG